MSDSTAPLTSRSAKRKPATASPQDADLSRQIEAAVERDPQDLVKCTRVSGSFYRCNWWTAASTESGNTREAVAPWAALASRRIHKSRFLSVSVSSSGKLKIEEVTPAGSPA